MFDFDVGKLIVIGIVALIAIPSKDLPRVLRQVGQAVGKIRRMAAEFQGQFLEAMRETELHEMREEFEKEKAKVMAEVDSAMTGANLTGVGAFDPMDAARKQIAEATEPPPVPPAEGAAAPEPPAQPAAGGSAA